MRKILYTSKEVRQAIIRLFKFSKGRRIAISAFVGEDAEAYLPKPEGLELICWPKAGGTNPNVLRKLTKRGVKIFFIDGLHMKVYWSEDKGAVLTSANLSKNALGSGNLKEVGVLLAPGEIDIDLLIQSFQLRLMCECVHELKRLDRDHKVYFVKNRGQFKRGRMRSYGEWYESPLRPEWKLGWWESTGAISSEAKRICKADYGVKDPHNFVDARTGDYKEGDWILTFELKARSTAPDWLFADYVISVPSSDVAYNEEYPFQAVQVWSKSRYPAPPFSVNNKRFKRAFSKAVSEFGPLRIRKLKSSKPPKRLIELISKSF